MKCCSSIQSVDCDVHEILRRIGPIQYKDGVLVVSSQMSVENALVISNQPVSVVSGNLDLPGDSTIDGTPLNALPFTGDILELPPQTTINNFSILTTNFFYFFNVSNSYLTSGNYIINSLYSGATITDGIKFPFFAPEDCYISSFIFTFAVGTSAPSTITEATGYIDVIDTLGNITYTGISATIPICPRGTKYYAEKKINSPYFLIKGHSAGVRFTFNGTAGSWRQFAVLGYKFAPPV